MYQLMLSVLEKVYLSALCLDVKGRGGIIICFVEMSACLMENFVSSINVFRTDSADKYHALKLCFQFQLPCRE